MHRASFHICTAKTSNHAWWHIRGGFFLGLMYVTSKYGICPNLDNCLSFVASCTNSWIWMGSRHPIRINVSHLLRTPIEVARIRYISKVTWPDSSYLDVPIRIRTALVISNDRLGHLALVVVVRIWIGTSQYINCQCWSVLLGHCNLSLDVPMHLQWMLADRS